MSSRLSECFLEVSRGDPALEEKLLKFVQQYYATRIALSNTDYFDDSRKVTFGATAGWIKGMLDNPHIHDEDYNIFRGFQNTESIILDVGANWGYSAGAFIKLGVKAKIISFEPIGAFESALLELRRRYPRAFSFYLTGLGERQELLNFIVPVVNGRANSGLCSASESPFFEGLVKNIIFAVKANHDIGDWLKIQFFDFTGQVSTLDQLVPLILEPELRALPIEAIKIDVEGLECKVLRGGQTLLQRHRPMILAEGANRTAGITELMEALGYVYAERDGDWLCEYSGLGRHSNGFFIHKSRCDEYRSVGILR
jgi:FkbM family methyltransferase